MNKPTPLLALTFLSAISTFSHSDSNKHIISIYNQNCRDLLHSDKAMIHVISLNSPNCLLHNVSKLELPKGATTKVEAYGALCNNNTLSIKFEGDTATYRIPVFSKGSTSTNVRCSAWKINKITGQTWCECK